MSDLFDNSVESEDESDGKPECLQLQGVLSKWTNYIHGWQNRFIVLQDGKLSYYKTQEDSDLGCRGSLSVYRAVVKIHDIDDCRFDVCLNDSVWYLRANSVGERQKWVDYIERQKECGEHNHYGSSSSLSHISINSLNFKRSNIGLEDVELNLKSKISELEIFRSIIVKQMETLQTYFNMCSNNFTGHNHNVDTNLEIGQEATNFHPSPTRNIFTNPNCSINDFKREALTFKATTTGIVTTLNQCVEVMMQHKQACRMQVEKEVEKRRNAELRIKELTEKVPENSTKIVVMGSPDYEEGPHSVLDEEDFYDAVETALDKMNEEEEFRERLRQRQRSKSHRQPATLNPLWPTIEKFTNQQLEYAREAVVGGMWQLFNEDGEMKLYRRELEEGGLVMDPLKAIHQIRGVTAHEMCHHFWSPDVRFDWDTTIEQMTVLDSISDDTLVFLQLHKRVWPTAQRDAVFWSHIRKICQDQKQNKDQNSSRRTKSLGGRMDSFIDRTNSLDCLTNNSKIRASNLEDQISSFVPHDTWIVCNKSADHTDAPGDNNCVRVDLLVCLLCETFVDKSSVEISRNDIICKVTYCSIVNPGGWAPASVLRAVYKREYPRFLKRFTQYVRDKCQDQPIAFSGLKILNNAKHWRG